jgi:mannose-6-phosphate isomerase-like protein (cupin superfamily)
MRGLVPRIHVLAGEKSVDGRDKPGRDVVGLCGVLDAPPALADHRFFPRRHPMDEPRIAPAEMARNVARFGALKGSSEAYLDSRLPGHRRTKINLIGMGVVEAEADPALRPAIPLPAHGFNLGMIVAERGNGAALHAHKTEDVFMPLVGAWTVLWREGEATHEIVLQPFDAISVPIGVYRGFRYDGEGKGVLLTLIGGPEPGKVAWHESVLAAAAATGLGLDSLGRLVELATAK